jgi:hypothetical protein
MLAVPLATGSPIDPPPEYYSGIQPSMRAETQIVRQIEAWNKGDLETALQAYCPREEIVWVNDRGVSRGYASFARSMRRQFGRSRQSMGTLAIKVEQALDLAENKALLTVRWSVTRGGRRVMGGISSQLWAMCGGQLRVVFEHSS